MKTIKTNKTEKEIGKFQYNEKNILSKSFIKEIMKSTDRSTIESTYYNEREHNEQAKFFEENTLWLKWNRAKRNTRKRQESFLILLSMKEIEKLSWSIDQENSNRVKPKIVVRETVKDKNGVVVHRIGDLIDNEKYQAIENLIVVQLGKYEKLSMINSKIYNKGYRLSYGNLDKSVSVVQFDGRLVNKLTNDLFDSIESYVDSLPEIHHVLQCKTERITSELIADWKESEKQGLYDREQLKIALKTYNHYMFFKVNTSVDEEVSYVYDNGDIVITNLEDNKESYIPSEFVTYDTESISGSNIARKGDTFIPIYVLPEKVERVLPKDESLVKITNGKRTTTVVQTWKAKAKPKEEKVKKISNTQQWLYDNDPKYKKAQ
jgi:hypothetical protein